MMTIELLSVGQCNSMVTSLERLWAHPLTDVSVVELGARFLADTSLGEHSRTLSTAQLSQIGSAAVASAL